MNPLIFLPLGDERELCLIRGYRGGSSTKLQYFLVASTCLLYLVGAGLFSRAVWSLEQGKWNKIVGSDASELGSGPGSYDIDKVVWHVNVSSASNRLINNERRQPY